MNQSLEQLAARVGAALKRNEMMLATAESCTGGWLGQAVTAVAGSSDWYERGFITYTYISKREMLGVRDETLERYGAVSEAAVREMAEGALAHSHAQVAAAISGIAGPSGGSREKPVGTVCFAWALKGGATLSETRQLDGDRDEVRRQSVEIALSGLLDLLHGEKTAGSKT
ncbi:MAG: CinA family protein [Betaproteobacteria bacterium]|nr:CinA family protein [Betaproteobacteria bacterium]